MERRVGRTGPRAPSRPDADINENMKSNTATTLSATRGRFSFFSAHSEACVVRVDADVNKADSRFETVFEKVAQRSEVDAESVAKRADAAAPISEHRADALFANSTIGLVRPLFRSCAGSSLSLLSSSPPWVPSARSAASRVSFCASCCDASSSSSSALSLSRLGRRLLRVLRGRRDARALRRRGVATCSSASSLEGAGVDLVSSDARVLARLPRRRRLDAGVACPETRELLVRLDPGRPAPEDLKVQQRANIGSDMPREKAHSQSRRCIFSDGG